MMRAHQPSRIEARRQGPLASSFPFPGLDCGPVLQGTGTGVSSLHQKSPNTTPTDLQSNISGAGALRGPGNVAFRLQALQRGTWHVPFAKRPASWLAGGWLPDVIHVGSHRRRRLRGEPPPCLSPASSACPETCQTPIPTPRSPEIGWAGSLTGGAVTPSATRLTSELFCPCGSSLFFPPFGDFSPQDLGEISALG